MRYYALFSRWRERWIRLHSAMVGRSLAAFGGGRIEHPVLVNRPDRVFVGSDVVICAGVMLSSVVGDGTDDGGTIRIGDRVVIRENVQITAADVIRIDDGVAIGRNCLIADHDHGYQLLDRSILDNPLTPARPVVLEAGCLIGSCSRIAPGVRVGRHALIGFGSVVTRDVPAFAVAAGAPARLLRRYHPETGRWETA